MEHRLDRAIATRIARFRERRRKEWEDALSETTLKEHLQWASDEAGVVPLHPLEIEEGCPATMFLGVQEVFARLVVQAARTLTPPAEAELKQLFAGGEAGDGILGGWAEQFALAIVAQDYCSHPSRLLERHKDLANLAIRLKPPERTRQYLIRVAECYLHGLDAATIVLCRSALESALDHRCDESQCSRASTLEAKIKFASLARWFTPDECADANTVRLRGKIAAHHDPTATKDTLGTIRMTMTLVDKLT
jgi:hypothetical protein